MGYSVYAIAKNKKLQNKMFEFLVANFQNYREAFKDEISMTGVRVAKGCSTPYGVSYADDENAVGFDYASWTFSLEKHYVTTVAMWISEKIGDGKHYWYDSEKTKIHSPSEEYLEFLRHDCGRGKKGKQLYEKSLQFIRNEIARLDRIWENDSRENSTCC